MIGGGAEQRIQSTLHAHYVTRLVRLLPADMPGAEKHAHLDIATKAAAPDADADAAVARLVDESLSRGEAAALVAAARDLSPDLERVVDAAAAAVARAEATFVPRVVGGAVLGIGAIAAMALWEGLGLPPGTVYLMLLPQLAAAGLILYGLFDRQRARAALAVARAIRGKYHRRRAAAPQ